MLKIDPVHVTGTTVATCKACRREVKLSHYQGRFTLSVAEPTGDAMSQLASRTVSEHADIDAAVAAGAGLVPHDHPPYVGSGEIDEASPWAYDGAGMDWSA